MLGLPTSVIPFAPTHRNGFAAIFLTGFKELKILILQPKHQLYLLKRRQGAKMFAAGQLSPLQIIYYFRLTATHC
jgi:hypothetical protein